MYMAQKVVFEACSVSILPEIVIDDVIYDCLSFVNKHPGGETQSQCHEVLQSLELTPPPRAILAVP